MSKEVDILRGNSQLKSCHKRITNTFRSAWGEGYSFILSSACWWSVLSARNKAWPPWGNWVSSEEEGSWPWAKIPDFGVGCCSQLSPGFSRQMSQGLLCLEGEGACRCTAASLGAGPRGQGRSISLPPLCLPWEQLCPGWAFHQARTRRPLLLSSVSGILSQKWGLRQLLSHKLNAEFNNAQYLGF